MSGTLLLLAGEAALWIIGVIVGLLAIPVLIWIGKMTEKKPPQRTYRRRGSRQTRR